MSSSEHQQHAEKHDMSCNAAGLGIMYLHRGLRPELIFLDVKKTGLWLV